MRLADLRPGLALCLVLIAAAPVEARVSFRTTEEADALASGSDNPQAVTIADVNGDGIGDVIAVEPDSDEVTVFINDGEGELEGGEPFFTNGARVVAVATGRFNADNFIDIVTANADDGTISVLLNDGEGVFDDEDPSRFLVAANPMGIAVADLNGDSRDDLAVLSPDVVYLLQNGGDGTFSPFVPATISTRSSNAFAIADGFLDSNNIPDLIISNPSSGQFVVYLGTGTGTFNFNGFITAGAEPTGLVIADANGDLTNDLIAVDSDSGALTTELLFLPNDGDALFPMTEFGTGPQEPTAITTLDVEPDGKVDLALTSSLDEIFLLCQLSDKCTELPSSTIEVGIWRSSVAGTIRGCQDGGQVAIASGKLNGDSMDDLVALQGDLTTLCIMINTSSVGADPTATPVGTVPNPTPTGPTPTFTETRTPTNTPTPTQIPTIGLRECTEESAGGTSFGRPVSVTTEDFDSDGTRDVAVADQTGNRILILSTSLGAPSDDICAAFDIELGTPLTVTAPETVVATDLDRNSRADLVVIGAQGVSLFYGNGQGAFVPSAANPIAAGTDPSDVAVTDFNRDSTPDLIVSDAASEDISIFLGTRQPNQPFGGRCAMRVGGRTNKVIAADLNVDGRSDFAATSAQNRAVSVFVQRSNASFNCADIGDSFQGQSTLNLPQGSQPSGLVSGIFVQTDSVPDLVVSLTQAGANGTALLYEGRAAGAGGVTYVQGTAVAVPTPKGGTQAAVPSAIDTGDIERDGQPDLILTDMANNSVAQFRGQPSGGLGIPLDALVLEGSQGPVDLDVADIDRDGRDDVVVANAGNGSVTYLLSGLRLPTPTPTVTNTPMATSTTPPGAGTATASPTTTRSPTRTRRPSATPSPAPTNTKRGVVTLSGGGCTVDGGSNDDGTLMLAAVALMAFVFRRRAVPRPWG